MQHTLVRHVGFLLAARSLQGLAGSAAACCLLLVSGCGSARADETSAVQAIMARHGCGGCHTIPGVQGASATVGPPLTALGRRVYVGGRVNTPGNLTEFIQNPSAHRPSSMPDVGIQPRDAERVARYLVQLR